jgi:hypothetical protein
MIIESLSCTVLSLEVCVVDWVGNEVEVMLPVVLLRKN